MSKLCRPVSVVYNVGDLKAAFEDAKERHAGLGGTDLTNPMGQAQCAYRNANTVLDVLKTFNDHDFLAMPGRPLELIMPTDALTKTFMEYYKAGKCVSVPAAQANHLLGIDLE